MQGKAQADKVGACRSMGLGAEGTQAAVAFRLFLTMPVGVVGTPSKKGMASRYSPVPWLIPT